MTDLDNPRIIANETGGTAPGADTDAVWIDVCRADRAPLDRGVAALVDDQPVAIFRLSPTADSREDEWFAVSHIDPATGAPIMARGLVGSAGAPPVVIPTLASPLHKQRYNLRTGACLDDESLHLQVFDIRVTDGMVEVCSSPK